MDYWFVADLHDWHTNIIKYCNRPFLDAKEMHEAMVERWNSRVKPKDIIYVLGDFVPFRGQSTVERTVADYNGYIYLVPGNHDKVKAYCNAVMDVLPPIHQINIPGNKMVLCHYSMNVWPQKHHGTYHIFGHSHGTVEGIGRSMDVGVDTNNFYPYHLDEIVARLSKIPAPQLG